MSRIDLGLYLAWVASCIRRDGWTSRKVARAYRGHLEATPDQAFRYMTLPKTADLALRREADEYEPIPYDLVTGKRTLKWAYGRKPPKELTVSRNGIALAAELVTDFMRQEGREYKVTPEFDVSGSRHLGAVGERLDLDVHVVKIVVVGEFTRDTMQSVHTLVTPTGDLLVWNAFGRPLEAGKLYSVRATVESHVDTGELKKTVVNRVVPVRPPQDPGTESSP